MKRTRPDPDDSALFGAGWVVLVWILLAALIGAIYRRQITQTIERSFLAMLFLTGSGLFAPVYGGLVYFGARRREQRRRARGSGIATVTLFMLSLALAGVILWLLRALGSVG